MKKLLITFVCLSYNYLLFAQQYSVSGVVTDENNKPVLGAAVAFLGTNKGTTTNNTGEYTLSTTAGTYTLVAQFLGKKDYSAKITLNSNRRINIKLETAAIEMQEVIKTAEREDSRIKSIAGIEKLTFSELENIPLLMGELDVVNSILLLPGVTNVGEGSSGFNVRGGKIDQNLITLDGSEIFNSSHLLGFFSVFNADVVEDFTLYKGYIPSTYGGRLSSVLDVQTKEGNMQSWSTDLSVGFVSSKFLVQGPVISDKLSVMASGRFAYPTWILRQTEDIDIKTSDARFDDQNIILSYQLGERNRIIGSYYRSFDRFKFSDDFQFEWSNQLIKLEWKSAISDHLFNSLRFNSSEYNNDQLDFDVNYSIANGMDFKSVTDHLVYDGLTNNELKVGFDIKHYDQKPEKRIPRGDSGFTELEIEKDEALLSSIFIDNKWGNNAVNISAGIRYNDYRQLGTNRVLQYEEGQTKSELSIIDTTFIENGPVSQYSNLEPRIGINYFPTPNISIKGSYNRVQQFIHLISNTTSAAPTDLWQVSTTHIKPQEVDSYSFGFSFTGTQKRWQNSFDIFYRDIHNIYDYKDFASLLLNGNLETEIVSGQGRAYGFELMFEKKKGNWQGWIGYTWSKSELKMDNPFPQETINQGEWYASNFDQRHNLSIVMNRDAGKNFYFSFNLIFNTGRPFTGVESSYVINNANVPLFSERNKYRIPHYTRVDVGCGFKSIFKKLDDRLNFSIYNLFSRDNAFSIYYRKPNSTAIIPFSYQLTVLGDSFPAFNYQVSFGK
ncbi:MAG: TonB-dependent receptor [bacterium]|nr:TonB-dependent receptor [bacterium]